MKIREFPWLEIIFAFCALVTGHLVAIGLNGEPLFAEWCPGAEYYRIPLLIFMVVICVITSAILVMLARKHLRLSNLAIEECMPRKVLIAFLSTSNASVTFQDGKMVVRQIIDQEEISVELDGNNLDADIEKLNSIRWNWQQLLRSLQRHSIPNGGQVFLIGSKATESDTPKPGSQDQLDDAEKLIKLYFKGLTIGKTEKGVDFEKFKELLKCINDIIGRYKKSGFGEDDIIIDVTGGPKTASIAGAIITLNTGVQFHYISTIDPSKCVAYDISYTPPPKPE